LSAGIDHAPPVTRLAGAAVELMMLRSRIGALPALWTTAYAALAVPFSLLGRVRSFAAVVEGEPVTIACAGRPERFERLLPRLFPESSLVETGHRRPLWRPRRLDGLMADVLAVELHPWMASRFRRAGWAVVPQYVRWRAPATDVPPTRSRRSLRKNLNRVQAFAHEVEVVTHPTAADLREFRVEMAQPLARRRFGALAWEPSQALFRSLTRRCELLFVCVGDQRVAGQMILRYRDEMLAVMLGVRGADPSLLGAGVQSALYAAFFDYARRSGVGTVDVGVTSSFLNDGVAFYKRQWGLAPHHDRMAPLIALRVDFTSPGAAAAFAREPLTTLTATGLGRFPD
jgi:hypothetical protein